MSKNEKNLKNQGDFRTEEHSSRRHYPAQVYTYEVVLLILDSATQNGYSYWILKFP